MESTFNLDKALIRTAKLGSVEIVRVLLNRGVNIHAHNNEALRCAAYSGYVEVAKLLRKYGASQRTG